MWDKRREHATTAYTEYHLTGDGVNKIISQQGRTFDLCASFKVDHSLDTWTVITSWRLLTINGGIKLTCTCAMCMYSKWMKKLKQSYIHSDPNHFEHFPLFCCHWSTFWFPYFQRHLLLVDPDIQTIALWILLMLVLLLVSFSLFHPFLYDLPLMIFVFQLIFLFELIFVFFFVSCIVAMMELPLMQWTCLEAVQKTLGWWQNHAAVGWYADNGNAIFGILSERELNAWLARKKQGTRRYSESSSEAIV